ncbi:MAG: 50S ribosomal protein L21, partial [Planctomycetales bacterium]
AIIEDSGTQIRVEEGQKVQIDFRTEDSGSEITFDRVLAVFGDDPQIGTPVVEGASVTAEILGPLNGPKLVIQKMRRRKNSRRKNGHRQLFTEVKINKIQLPG